MLGFKVKLININGSQKKFKLESKSLMACESTIVEEYLCDLDDGSSAIISQGSERMTLITKDKTKKHWNHNGYRFSG
jgi:hypothetical protein